MLTFWPSVSTWVPAATNCIPLSTPAAITTSLPSTPATSTLRACTDEDWRSETLQSEVWATKASAIAVRLIDDNQQLIAHYEVEQGQWQCLQQHDAADDHTVELNPFLQSSGHD